ncbi:hypothetical protein GGI1_02722 [Acidithiobacillus sp. GGI-221]|nr:hypothetical protein GGI1_02722 [Acidithiobacillus sp. GGI-221]
MQSLFSIVLFQDQPTIKNSPSGVTHSNFTLSRRQMAKK